MTINTFLVVLALLIINSCAQLQSQGKWTPKPLSEQTHTKHVLPPQDNANLIATEDNSHGGYQFANVINFPITFDSWGPAMIQPNGDRVWRTTIVSENAQSLGVTFSGFRIPEGGELYSVGANNTRGAYTHINNRKNNGHVTLFPIEGNFLVLEYYQPAEVKSLPVLDIAKVAHGYKPLAPLCFDCSGSCNINAICHSGEWHNQIRSVGILLTASGGRFCSGSLINNVDSNGDQLFLTAYHCQADSSDSVTFNYQSPTCDPSNNGPTGDNVADLERLVFNSLSDFLLLRINERIPDHFNAYLNGISGVNTPGQALAGIHHPSGDVKKISFSHGPATHARWTGGEPGEGWHWRVPFWADGTTEPGSSGSPLFDQHKRVVGQLHGGPASCTTISYDLYGATWASWGVGLSSFTDPSDTGILLVDGIDLNTARDNYKKRTL